VLGDDGLLLIALGAGLWLGAIIALLARRPRIARWIALLAVLLSVATLAVLRAGTGHRA
jgi:xanthosine utilization system XapX-like protein